MGDKEEKLIYSFKKKISYNNCDSSSDSEPEGDDTKNKTATSNQDWKRKDDATTSESSTSNWRNPNSERKDSRESELKQCSNPSSEEKRPSSDSKRENLRGPRDWNDILPSQVFDEKIICLPPNEELEDDCETTINWGKWMIFPKGHLDKLDSYWIALKPLYESGILSKLKASTAADERDGVINCYTRDADNEAEVKRAGDAIRERIDHEYIIYYKTNAASLSGQYRQEGSVLISKYMHTVRGGFYSRDNYDRWRSVDE